MKSRFTEDQIIGVLRETLENENRRLKKLLASPCWTSLP